MKKISDGLEEFCIRNIQLSLSKNNLKDDLTVLRRICDRGLALSLAQQHSRFVDLFQHLKDEIDRMKGGL